MHSRIASLLAVSFGTMICGCGTGGVRLDERTRTILAGATRVEVFRIDGRMKSDERPKKEDKQIAGYKVLSQGKDQGKDFAAKLSDLLRDNRSYTDTFAKCYWPGVVFRAWKGDESIDVVICYFCKNLYVGPPADSVRENASFYDSPREADFIKLAKTAFPDDNEIQELKAPGEK